MNSSLNIIKSGILFALLSLSVFTAPAGAQPSPEKERLRIVSLLPSTTEILFALGLNEEIIGVTKYCKYPPEAQNKTIVGGLIDTNYEIIYRLHPDLVVLATEHADHRAKLKDMGIPSLEVETRRVSSVLDSVQRIGEAVGREKEATAIIEKIQNKIDAIKEKTKGIPQPRVLITFLRPVGEGDIRDVYIAGNFTYFNDLLEIVGAENAYQGSQLITSPIMSAEGILQLDPDIIIEAMAPLNETHLTVQDVLKDWDILPELKAYKNKRIYILTGSYIDIPGPRLVDALDDIVRCVHPQIDWD